jgi:LysM repeat protein
MALDRTKTRSLRPILQAAVIFIVAALLAGLLPPSSAGAVTCKFKHKVKQGETLIYIANLYGVGWDKVADANQLNPPYTVIEAMVLCIPEGEKPSTTTGETNKDDKNPATLQVVPGITKLLVSVENFSKKTSYFVRVSQQVAWPLRKLVSSPPTKKAILPAGSACRNSLAERRR